MFHSIGLSNDVQSLESMGKLVAAFGKSLGAGKGNLAPRRQNCPGGCLQKSVRHQLRFAWWGYICAGDPVGKLAAGQGMELERMGTIIIDTGLDCGIVLMGYGIAPGMPE